MPGEILGVAGVAGNGQEQLANVLLGLQREKIGEVRLLGNKRGKRSVSSLLNAGVGCIPEDSLGSAVVPEMRVDENLLLGQVDRYLGNSWWMHWPSVTRQIASELAAFTLPLPSFDKSVGGLSGGNIQRVVLARELSRNPKVLVAYYPTRGLDVATTEETRRLLLALREQGSAILLISEDLDELLALSDRMMVMHAGRALGPIDPSTTSPYGIGLLMTGHGE